jgi:RNA polymerase sigma factor (sigma-70 family)
VHLAAEIFSKYGDFIRGVIRYKAGDEGNVDDLFQNFFISLVYRPPCENVKNIKGYLYRAIINDIIDSRRRVERYQNRMHNYAEYINCSAAEDEPEKVLIETEEMNKMFRCIETQLQHYEAKAVILRYKKNYKIKEVAKSLDINNIAAWRYISTGVRKIRRFLGEDLLQ